MGKTVINDKSDYNSVNLDLENSGLYLFFDYEDIMNFFPFVNWSSFNQFEQLLIVLVINVFYLLFWAFVIWIVLKLVYKVFQMI